MNLGHLRYFVKLAEVRHYTKATEQLCISQLSPESRYPATEEQVGRTCV